MKNKRIVWIILCMILIFTACSGENKVKPRETEEVTLEQGMQAVKDGEHEKAIIILTKVIEREPENGEAYVYRGDAYMYAAKDLIDGNSSTEEEKDEKINDYLDCAEEDYSKAEDYNYEDSDYIDNQKELLGEVISEYMEKQIVPTPEEQAATENALANMEYAMIISALQQMGCSDVTWDVWDGDSDGYHELYMTAYADDTYRQSQLLADINGPYMTAHVATGAAGSSEYLTIYGYDGYILQDGYYTAANTTVNYYEWSGSQWEQIQPATGAADFAVFPNPDLTCTWLDMDYAKAVSLMHDSLIGRENFMGDFHMDMDSDGIGEYVYFYQGAANRWFGRLTSDSNFGSEYYLKYTDYTTCAIVVNWNQERNQTCVRIADFGETYGLDVMIDGNIMTFDGEDYAYQKEGIPFLYQGAYEEYIPEPSDGTVFDLGYATLSIPESIIDRVAVIEDGMSIAIYEANDYQLGGGGYIRTIGLSTEYETEHPARQIYASIDVDGVVYFVYTLDPTDVPYIDMNNVAAGMAVSEELNLQFLLDHMQAKEGYEIDWFIG